MPVEFGARLGTECSIAAYCEIDGGHTVMFDASRCNGRCRDCGTRIQPSRQPVIEKYFDTDPTTADSREVDHAVEVAGVPGVANSMP